VSICLANHQVCYATPPFSPVPSEGLFVLGQNLSVGPGQSLFNAANPLQNPPRFCWLIPATSDCSLTPLRYETIPCDVVAMPPPSATTILTCRTFFPHPARPTYEVQSGECCLNKVQLAFTSPHSHLSSLPLSSPATQYNSDTKLDSTNLSKFTSFIILCQHQN
jgi:hypothetical protein